MGDPMAREGSSAGDFARQVEAALEKFRPALQAEGGDIELLEVIGRNAHVLLAGACHG
jgi:Fe-S cluster biogenesis protein NfuA